MIAVYFIAAIVAVLILFLSGFGLACMLFNFHSGFRQWADFWAKNKPQDDSTRPN